LKKINILADINGGSFPLYLSLPLLISPSFLMNLMSQLREIVCDLCGSIDRVEALINLRSVVGRIDAMAEWRTATGNAATVATAKFYVVKDNKAENIW
jgi:hypothetical protein